MLDGHLWFGGNQGPAIAIRLVMTKKGYVASDSYLLGEVYVTKPIYNRSYLGIQSLKVTSRVYTSVTQISNCSMVLLRHPQT